jgi:hypothetical protein
MQVALHTSHMKVLNMKKNNFKSRKTREQTETEIDTKKNMRNPK